MVAQSKQWQPKILKTLKMCSIVGVGCTLDDIGQMTTAEKKQWLVSTGIFRNLEYLIVLLPYTSVVEIKNRLTAVFMH